MGLQVSVKRSFVHTGGGPHPRLGCLTWGSPLHPLPSPAGRESTSACCSPHNHVFLSSFLRGNAYLCPCAHMLAHSHLHVHTHTCMHILYVCAAHPSSSHYSLDTGNQSRWRNLNTPDCVLSPVTTPLCVKKQNIALFTWSNSDLTVF